MFHGRNLSPTAVDFLADFGSLTHCCLTCLQTLDVAPLKSLLHLSDLTLESLMKKPATLSNLYALSYLTKLSMHQGVVGFPGCPVYRFVSTLHHLNLSTSGIVGIHGDGLAACKHLKTLFLLDSYTLGATANQSWQMVMGRPPTVAANMSSLTKLSNLCLSLSDYAIHSDLAWIWELHQMQALHLRCSDTMTIGPSLTRLSQLTRLTLHGTFDDDEADYDKSVWHLDVDWKLMRSFCELKLISCKFDCRLSGLVQLQSFKTIFLRFIPPVNEDAFDAFIRFVCALKSLRQDVSLQLHHDVV